MTTYSESAVREALDSLLDEHDLTWDEFLALGEADELMDLSSDLDFAYRALVPSLGEPTTAA